MPLFGQRNLVCPNWSWHGGIHANSPQVVNLLEHKEVSFLEDKIGVSSDDGLAVESVTDWQRRPSSGSEVNSLSELVSVQFAHLALP